MNTYLLFKSIHLIAVISWMAGLLYLPRLFVYHTEALENKKSKDLISLLIALINSELLIEFSELLSVHCPQVVSKVKHKALDINIYIVNIINFI